MASNAWNLSTDYYDILPADSEMDADNERCEYCDGYTEEFVDDYDYYIPLEDRCECGEDE